MLICEAESFPSNSSLTIFCLFLSDSLFLPALGLHPVSSLVTANQPSCREWDWVTGWGQSTGKAVQVIETDTLFVMLPVNMSATTP